MFEQIYKNLSAVVQDQGNDFVSKSCQFELKDSNEAEGTFTGFASTFGNIDNDGDIIAKGAFNESLASGKVVKMLWQHDTREVIGKFVEFQETDQGLAVKGKLTMGVNRAREAFHLLKDGALDMSVGFKLLDSDFNESGNRVIKSADLMEVSLVTFPANNQAKIFSVKSIDNERDLEKLLRDAGFSRNDSKIIISKGYRSLKDLREAEENSDEIVSLFQQFKADFKNEHTINKAGVR
jgi:HK97 family phage prohead protease